MSNDNKELLNEIKKSSTQTTLSNVKGYYRSGDQIVNFNPIRSGIRKVTEALATETKVPVIGINPMQMLGYKDFAGMAKAIELALANLNEERKGILELKNYLIERLENEFPDFKINGSKDGFYNVLNIILPFSEGKSAMILFGLDIKGIAVSRGSACQSGSAKPSHVLAEFLSDEDLKKPSLRVSFSHYNTKNDIDLLIDGLKGV